MTVQRVHREAPSPPSHEGNGRSILAWAVALGGLGGSAWGVIESTAWLVYEVILKSFYVQDQHGAFTVLRELVDTTVLGRAGLLYGALGALGALPAGGLAIVAARRRIGGTMVSAQARAIAMLGTAGVLGLLEVVLIRRGSLGALWPPESVGPGDGLAFGAVVLASVLVHDRVLRRVEGGLRLLRRFDGRWWLRGGLGLACLVALGLVNAVTIADGRPSREVPSSADARGRPSVLFVVLDTARADRFSSLGHDRPTTPSFDALARRGVLFEQAWSTAPWTLPSHGSLFTGELPHRHGAHWGPLQLDPSLGTLAESFRAVGYRTAAFTNNPWIGSVSGLDRGFEEVHELWRDHGGAWDRLIAHRLLRRIANRPHDEGAAATARVLEDWLGAHREEPCFVFVNLMEVHDPNWPAPGADRFLPPGTTRARLRALNQNPYAWFAGTVEMDPADFELLRDLYDAQLAYVDGWLGRIVENFESARATDDRIIVVVGDHGENLGDHGAMSHVFSLSDALLHVPLLMVGKGLPAGLRIDTPVSTADVAPTLERLASLPAAGAPGRAGRDLFAAEAPVARPLFAENYTPVAMLDLLESIREDIDLAPFDRSLVAVRDGALKLVTASDGERRLFDLSVDPRELWNLASSLPHEVERLEALGERSMEAVHGARERESVSGAAIDPGTRERLEELGYALPSERPGKGAQ